MACCHAPPWMVIPVRGVHKGPDLYIQREAFVACAYADLLFQTWNSTLQTT